MADCTQPSGGHGDCDPDTCFAAKVRYMRENGGLAVHYPWGGRQNFKGPTIREKQKRIVERAAENGWEARQVNPLYDRPPGSFDKK